MASKFICECGYLIRTNAFEGHGIYSLISDNEIDQLSEPINEESLTELWFSSQHVIKCSKCGILFLSSTDGIYEAYKRVE